MSPLLPWLDLAWLCGVAFLFVRFAIGMIRVQQLKTRRTSPVGEFLIEMLQSLQAQLGVCRSVRLLQSGLVQVPTVIGWMRPVILLPASVITGLTPTQLQSILAHELAHVRRHDYLVNLVQSLIEIALFYHPAVWWASRCIRLEREQCCDDIAVRLCGDRVAYARALASLEELRAASPEFALAANGGSLLRRVRRLLKPDEAGQANRARVWLLVSVTLVLVAGALLFIKGVMTPKLYEAEARFVFEPEFSEPQLSSNASLASTPMSSIQLQTELEILKSNGLFDSVLKRLSEDGWPKLNEAKDPYRFRSRIQQRVRVVQIPNTLMVSVRARDEDPKIAAKIANYLVEKYIDNRLDLRMMRATDLWRWLRSEREGMDLRLLQLRTNLKEVFTTLEYDRVKHDIELYQRLRDDLYQRLVTVEIEGKSKRTDARIVDRARDPDQPVRKFFGLLND
jgi:beta-lactamase regulating signal transducer with metallopeptidase domain